MLSPMSATNAVHASPRSICPRGIGFEVRVLDDPVRRGDEKARLVPQRFQRPVVHQVPEADEHPEPDDRGDDPRPADALAMLRGELLGGVVGAGDGDALNAHVWAPRSACDTWPASSAKAGIEPQLGWSRVGERHVERGHDAAGAGRHHEHPRRQEDRFGDRVGDEQRAEPEPLEQRDQLVVEALAGDLVDGAERLVEQEHVRFEHQRPGERGPHAHPARELLGVLVLGAGQADELRCSRPPVVARSAFERPSSSANSSTLRRTVRHCSNVASWKT